MTVNLYVINEEMALGLQAMAGGWNTGIVPLSGGYEHRNKNQAQPRRRYEVQYNNKDLSVINAIQAFIDGAEGAYSAFLAKDWSNYQLTDHTILTATGGETTAQIKQIWGTISQFSRNLYYLKAGTLSVYKNSVLLNGTDSPPDYDLSSTGLITFAVALSAADVITVTVQFYVPVRFETDNFMVEVTGPSGTYAKVPRITLIEVLE